MNKTSLDFLIELRDLLGKYDVEISSTMNGYISYCFSGKISKELDYYVDKEILDDIITRATK